MTSSQTRGITEIESAASMTEVSEIKEWTFDEFFKYAILQALRAATENETKYIICVGNIEALMDDELSENKEYQAAIEREEKQLKKDYPAINDQEHTFVREFYLAKLKFRMIIRIFKNKMPKETTGEL